MTKEGWIVCLVNGAIGTVNCISSQKLIKFDHMDDPCPIEMVRGKFMLLKSFFCIPETVSCYCGLCSDNSQVSGVIP